MSCPFEFKLTDDVSWETMNAMYGRVVELESGGWFKAFLDWDEIARFLDVEEPTDEQREEVMRGYVESLIEAHLSGDVKLELHPPAEGPYGMVFKERFKAAA